MGDLFFYKNHENDLGDMSKRRWREVRKLLPLAVAYVNDAMMLDWDQGTRRSVLVSELGARPARAVQNDAIDVPPKGHVDVGSLLRDDADAMDEVIIQDAEALVRFFGWCAFLSQRDGVFELYAECVAALKRATPGVENYVSR